MGVIQLVGGCYLIYMGISMAKAGISTLRELRAGAAPALGSEALRSPKATFRQGFFTNMSNPKIVLFLTAVLSQFIPAGASVGTLVLCTLVLIASQITFFLFIAIVVSTDAVVKRMVLAGPWIDTVAGVIFLVLGALLVASGAEAAL